MPSSIAQKVLRAGALFAERGLDQTKIDDVAEITGVPKATLYYYFAGKEEILAFLLRDTLVAVADAVAIAVDAAGAARDRLLGVIAAQLQVMADQPDVCRALISDLGRAGRIPDVAVAITEGFYAPLEQLLREGEADGSLRRLTDPTATAVAIFGAVTVSGLSHLVVGGGGVSVSDVVARLEALLLEGLDPR
ncbi:MAG: TetR/AcrR family transcriptional regulator [Actinomycetota bacterium]